MMNSAKSATKKGKGKLFLTMGALMTLGAVTIYKKTSDAVNGVKDKIRSVFGKKK